MEFHLPYFALRRSPSPALDKRFYRQQGRDRALRQCGRLPPELEDPNSNEFIYEAQISVLITGIDEWFWTTYCFCDRFFKSEESVQTYHDWKTDAPTGGIRPVKYPVWNPREYFLFILSCRFGQVTKEWDVIVRTLDSRLQFRVRLPLMRSLRLMIGSGGQHLQAIRKRRLPL